MTMRKRAFFALLILAVLGLFAGVAAAEMGYGVGDGTGPIGTQPQNGTGEQYQGPPVTVDESDDGVVPPASEVTATQEQLRNREQLRLLEQDASCNPQQFREREQLTLHEQEQEQAQLGTQEQLREREQLRTQEHLYDGTCEPACDGDQDRLQDRDRIRQHTDS